MGWWRKRSVLVVTHFTFIFFVIRHLIHIIVDQDIRIDIYAYMYITFTYIININITTIILLLLLQICRIPIFSSLILQNFHAILFISISIPTQIIHYTRINYWPSKHKQKLKMEKIGIHVLTSSSSYKN